MNTRATLPSLSRTRMVWTRPLAISIAGDIALQGDELAQDGAVVDLGGGDRSGSHGGGLTRSSQWRKPPAGALALIGTG